MITPAHLSFIVVLVGLLTGFIPMQAKASEGYFAQGFSAFADSFYPIGGRYSSP
jgi:hypothetical protein